MCHATSANEIAYDPEAAQTFVLSYNPLHRNESSSHAASLCSPTPNISLENGILYGGLHHNSWPALVEPYPDFRKATPLQGALELFRGSA